MKETIKNKKVILVVVVVVITVTVLYFGGTMLMQTMSQIHVSPPH